MEMLNEAYLKKLKYSELKRFAKGKGVRGSMKADKMIEAILAQKKLDEDSFLSAEQQILNSCKKNKVAKFDMDRATPCDTPRRETYTLESPSVHFQKLNDDFIISSASPVLKLSPLLQDSSLNVTLTRGSEKKSMKKRKVSFLTPVRRSSRLSGVTPYHGSVKDRPKTPIPGRNSSVGAKPNRPSTPLPQSKLGRMNLSLTNLEKPLPTPDKLDETPVDSAAKATRSNAKDSVSTSGVKRKRSVTPSSSSKVKRTPNFQKLHKKEFEKMESIDEFQKRKAENSAKKIKQQQSSIPKRVPAKKNVGQKSYGGVPFIPSVTSTKDMNTNFAGFKTSAAPGGTKVSNVKKFESVPKLKPAKAVPAKLQKAASRENTPLNRGKKFDLKASLSKKLPYQPHKGPLKPLVETNASNSAPPKNKLVETKRADSRAIVKGVRMNRRFELQMSNRKTRK